MLALLLDGARYAFELVRELSSADGLVTSEGTIYPLLTRLRKEELVSTYWQELTPAGRRALADFAKDWSRFRDSVDDLLYSKGRR